MSCCLSHLQVDRTSAAEEEEATDAQQEAFALLSSAPRRSAAAEVLTKVLRNIVEHPTEAKYRWSFMPHSKMCQACVLARGHFCLPHSASATCEARTSSHAQHLVSHFAVFVITIAWRKNLHELMLCPACSVCTSWEILLLQTDSCCLGIL